MKHFGFGLVQSCSLPSLSRSYSTRRHLGWTTAIGGLSVARLFVLFLVRGGVSTYRWKAPFKGFLPVHMGVGLGLGLGLGLRLGLGRLGLRLFSVVL